MLVDPSFAIYSVYVEDNEQRVVLNLTQLETEIGKVARVLFALCSLAELCSRMLSQKPFILTENIINSGRGEWCS